MSNTSLGGRRYSKVALNHNLKLQEAIALEGYLGKQSPDMFHRYQQRYIKFLDHGLTLGYSDSKESFAHGKINGQIPLKDVVEVTVTTSNPKKFTVAVDGRTYKFEASSAEECTKWANAVKICREHALQQEQKSKEQVMAIDSDIRFEEANSTTESQPPSEGFFNPVGAVGAIANTAKKLIVGTAVKTSAAVVKTGVNVVGVVVGDKKSLKTNEEHLKAKHLDEALSRIDEKIVQSRVMMGYLLKEKKEATGVDLVDDFVNDAGLRDKIAQRWLFLISSKPINFDHVDPTDEETLDNGSLPFDIEQDVLYMYDEKCDDSKPLKSVYLKDVIDVVVWKKATNEQFYRFRLDLGDRKINMLTTNNTEMMNWIKAIQASRANLKEKSRSKLPIVKNLYWHYKILADEGEEALREKMNKDYDKLVPSGNVMTADNSASLIQIQEKVADELIKIINACLSHKDEQNEVIKIAMEVYHEPILNALRIFFQKNQANLENRDIFEIGKFLSRYREQIRAYGDAFADPRITIGTATISKIVGTRLLKANLKPVKNIIKNDMDKEPEINGAGKAVTNAPTDIFKVLNETFNVLPLCNTKEMAFALLETCAHTLEYFVNGLGTIIEYYKTTPDQLAAFCNNTISYTSSLKEFTKQGIELTHTSMETVAQYCDERGFTKSFISLGKKAYEKIAQILFSTVIGDQWNKTSFLDISLRSLEGVLEKARLVIEKMHNNFAVKVEAACLEKAVTYYVQAFLTSAEKKRFKPDDRSRIIRKFDDDVREFADIFSNLKKGMIDNYTEPISNFHNFLMSKFAFLPITVQSLKEEYGSALKWSTIELLIKLRDDDIEKNEKVELLKNCEEIYRSTERKEEKGKHFNVFKHLDQESNLANMRDMLKHMSSESSITDEDVLADPNLIRVRSRDESVRVRATVLNLEGYLEVEKDEFLSNVGANFIAQLKFETKYFNLKRDILFYYKDKASESAQGSYKVKELVNFGPEEDDLKMFYITRKRHKEGETRTIRFKAVTQERRDAWVAGLKAAQTLPDDGAMFELFAADINLFKDTRALFVDIEELPSLDFPPPPGPPVVTRAAAASVSTKAVEKSIEKHSEMANSVENTNRRRSFALGDERSDTPHVESTLQVEKEKKCCDSCAMF